MLETLETNLETKVSVEKLLYFFYILMENKIFFSYFTEIFVPPCIYKLIINNMLPIIYVCVYWYIIQHDSGLESCKYLILDDSVTQ